MPLFTKAQIEQINAVAEKSKKLSDAPKATYKKSMNSELASMSNSVQEYFKDSPAILISDVNELHDYVSKCIDFGYAGIDTETTGLDRANDTIVGASLYVPGMPECYIPMKHIIPIFDVPYKDQLSYEDTGKEFQRLVDGNVKLIFANADFDLAMIFKDLKTDLIDACYYDVILAWRCLKEDERDNSLKGLYAKYCLKGNADPKKFRDFFTPELFPYCKPEVAKLYAANDAKITYELFKWQLPYVTKNHPKCQKAHLESIADLVWNIEMPLIRVCQELHRLGMYIDTDVASVLQKRYYLKRDKANQELSEMVDNEIRHSSYIQPFGKKEPFKNGAEFNAESPVHTKHLLYNIMGIPQGKDSGTGKEILREMNLPITDKILEVRSYGVLINTFVDKMPNSIGSDGRIHGQFKSIGAATGRFSSNSPNLQNIPSHATDIRHMFRATPGYDLTVDCVEDADGNILYVSLPFWYEVKTGTGYKSVHNLEVGDEVYFLHDNVEVKLGVKALENSSEVTTLCNVIL